MSFRYGAAGGDPSYGHTGEEYPGGGGAGSVRHGADVLPGAARADASFHEGAKILMEDKSKFIMNIFYNILALSVLYLVPFFLLFGMGEVNINPTDVLVSSAYTMLIGAFVPIPGATGGIEYGYVSFFGQFIKGPILNASMLLWRGITYYVGLIIGAITLGLKKDVKK